MGHTRLLRAGIRTVLFLLIAGGGVAFGEHTVKSPDGSIQATVAINDAGRPVISAQLEGRTALEPGALGIRIDGTDLGDGATIQETSHYTIDRTYPWRGNQNQAHNHARGLKLKLRHKASDQPWTIDVRAYDTGIGWRYVVPGQDQRTVNGEASTFHLPSGTTLWYQTDLSIYENNYQSTRLTASGEAIDKPLGPPATGVLPDRDGYVCLSESNVLHYSGMALKAIGPTALKAFFHDDPKGWSMKGRITSPWRTAIIADDLNELVNSNLIDHLAPPPNETLFPEGVNTDWLDPGRSWWTWYVYDDAGAAWDRQKPFVDEAAKLNCDFHLVDAGWEGGESWNAGDSSQWDRLKELCDYAKNKDVAIWVWTAALEGKSGRKSPGLETKAKRQRFFRKLDEAGAVGVKIDYVTGESHRKLAIMEGCLRQAAKHQIMIDFHGVASPKGEARTWPNEMTREGVRAMEHNKWAQSTLEHWTALPFTRFVAGHGDITPGIVPVEDLKNLTAATPMAMAVIYTSPYLCWAGIYEDYQKSNITDFVKNLPTTWDETRVLPSSGIGQRVVMARRKGKQWYLAAIEGPDRHGKTIYKSDVLTGRDGAQQVDVRLNGADRLILRTTSAVDDYDFDHTNWANATLVTASGETVRLSSLEPVSSSQGWGSLKRNKSITGGPLRIDDQTYEHGLGTHADGTVVYQLKRDYKRFQARIGIDEKAKDRGSARFFVHVNDNKQSTIQPRLDFLGEERYDVKLIQSGDQRGTFNVSKRSDLTQASALTLPIDPGDGFAIIFTPK